MQFGSCPVDLAVVRLSLDEDRAAVQRFERRDPRGVKSIRDYLARFLSGLDQLQREAERLSQITGPERGPPRTGSGERYGDAERARPGART